MDAPALQDYKPKPLVPLSGSVELKEATVRDYKRSYERIGAPIDSQLLERLAVADLELVDAYKRGRDYSPNYKSEKPKPPPERAPDAAMRQSLETGEKLKLRDKSRMGMPRGFLNIPGDQIDEKWTFMMGRLKRIVEGATQINNRAAVLETTTCPDLALRLWRVQAAYMFRHRRSKHNPFTTATGGILNNRDAFRKLRRMLEDICDDSSGRMGPWWVPK